MNVLLLPLEEGIATRVDRALASLGVRAQRVDDLAALRDGAPRAPRPMVVLAVGADAVAQCHRARALRRGRLVVVTSPRPRDAVLSLLDAGADDVLFARPDDDGAAADDELATRLAVAQRHATDRDDGAGRAIAAIAAGLAHEIRNPLNGAQLHLKLLQHAIAAHPGREAVDALSSVRHDLDRIERLLGSFVAFAQPQPPRRERRDLVATARGVVRHLATVADGAGVRLRFFTQAESIPCDYDEARIGDALGQLVRNGIDAAGHGGDVTVAVRPADGAAQVVVEDSGPGVPPDVDVFAPFTTTKPTKLGLGLPSALRIVTDHGGWLSVARRDDRTSFAVHLPLAR